MAKAMCKGMTSVMFPEDGTGVVAAQRICSACEVIVPCLEYALEHRIDHGVWGGASERARRRMRRKLGIRGRRPTGDPPAPPPRQPVAQVEHPVIIRPHRNDVGQVFIDGSNVGSW